jgi:superfamily I DNA/RNA helicase
MKRRIARLIEVDSVDPERILAVTFTRTAARDLERELQKMGVSGCEDISAETVHSFCFKLLLQNYVFAFLGRIPRGLITFNNKGSTALKSRHEVFGTNIAIAMAIIRDAYNVKLPPRMNPSHINSAAGLWRPS